MKLSPPLLQSYVIGVTVPFLYAVNIITLIQNKYVFIWVKVCCLPMNMFVFVWNKYLIILFIICQGMSANEYVCFCMHYEVNLYSVYLLSNCGYVCTCMKYVSIFLIKLADNAIYQKFTGQVIDIQELLH